MTMLFPSSDYGLKQELKRHPRIQIDSVPAMARLRRRCVVGRASLKKGIDPVSLLYRYCDSPVGKAHTCGE